MNVNFYMNIQVLSIVFSLNPLKTLAVQFLFLRHIVGLPTLINGLPVQCVK